jgi:hypothetical protein
MIKGTFRKVIVGNGNRNLMHCTPLRSDLAMVNLCFSFFSLEIGLESLRILKSSQSKLFLGVDSDLFLQQTNHTSNNAQEVWLGNKR